MNIDKHVARNPRLLFWGRVLVATKILSAIGVLFYAHRGVGLDSVYYLSIVWSITSLITEVPSGYLADRIGRKRTLLLGVILLLISHIITLFAYGFWEFAISIIFLSASFSCFSGTEEALLYESLVHMGKSKDSNAHNGKQLSAGALPDIVMAIIAVLIAQDLREDQFQILIMINIGTSILAFIVLSFLQEPPHLKNVAKQEEGIYTESLRTLREHPWLRKAAINKFLVFSATFVTWRVYQPILKDDFGFSVIALGVFYTIMQSIEFFTGWFAGKFEQRFGIANITNWLGVLMIVALSIAMISHQPWIVFCALIIPLSTNALRSAMFTHAVNKRIHSRSRATTLSQMNLIKGMIDIPLLVLAGILSQFSLIYPLIIACVLCVIAVTLLPIRTHELE